MTLPVVLRVRFTEREYNVSEGEGVMTVGIELNRPSPQRITIRLVITGNTAEGNVAINFIIKNYGIGVDFCHNIRQKSLASMNAGEKSC